MRRKPAATRGERGGGASSQGQGHEEGRCCDCGSPGRGGRGGGNAGRRGSREVSSSSGSAPNRRRTASVYNTPISRPRNRQRENSPDGNENRIGSIMAMMMMSQASDRDERREEREERRQEFRLQIEMQRQQMQQQQNMMAFDIDGLDGSEWYSG